MVIVDTKGFAPLAIGMGLVGLIYMGGHISRAHYNPAVTLAFFINNEIAKSDILGYLVAQFSAAISAAWVGVYLAGEKASVMDLSDTPRVFLAEFLGTFILCFVILHVAIAKTTKGNSFYGVAIGFTVIGIASAFGWISGGAFNPSVAVGLGAIGKVEWMDIWIFFAANFFAAVVAARLFQWISVHEE